MRWHIFFGGCKFPSNVARTNLTLGNGPCIPIKWRKTQAKQLIFFLTFDLGLSGNFSETSWIYKATLSILYWYYDFITISFFILLFAKDCISPALTSLLSTTSLLENSSLGDTDDAKERAHDLLENKALLFSS